MSRTIAKFTHKKIDYYLEWSSIVDAPVTWGMPLEEFKVYYKKQYGLQGMKELPERLERVDKYGTSSYYNESTKSLICVNNAGQIVKELLMLILLNIIVLKKMYNKITIFIRQMLCKHSWMLILGKYDPFYKKYRCEKCDCYKERFNVPK